MNYTFYKCFIREPRKRKPYVSFKNKIFVITLKKLQAWYYFSDGSENLLSFAISSSMWIISSEAFKYLSVNISSDKGRIPSNVALNSSEVSSHSFFSRSFIQNRSIENWILSTIGFFFLLKLMNRFRSFSTFLNWFSVSVCSLMGRHRLHEI